MRKFYKSFLTLMLALIAMVANAEVKTIYTWDGNAKTSAEAATISGGTATAKGGDASVVAGSKQKNNWCLKLGKTYMVDNAPTHYVEIELAEPLKGGEEILINTFVTDGAKNATLGLNFNGLNEFTYAIEDRLTENGVPTTDVKTTVPVADAGCTKIRIYRKEGGTTPYVSKLVITQSDAPAGATFAISEVEGTEVTITPTPAETSWAAFCYPEGGREVFLSKFYLDASKSDAEVLQALIDYYVPVTKSAGEGDFDIEDFMGNFGGAEDGNYVVAVAELDGEGNVTGEATTKTVAYVAPAEPDYELEMNYAESETYTSDVDMIFQNEEWYARFDVKEVPVAADKIYTIDDLDLTYSYVKKKDAELDQNWTKYTYKAVQFSMKENGDMDALVTVEDADHNELVISMYYEVNDQKSIKLSGEYEVVDGKVAVTAKNIATGKAQYKLLLNLNISDFEDGGMYQTDALVNVGNSIKTPWTTEEVGEKIVEADIYAMLVDGKVNLRGSVNSETYTYNINITLTKKEGEQITLDMGNLAVSEDEGDLKLKAEKDGKTFVAFIAGGTTGVDLTNATIADGTYSVCTYSKFGETGMEAALQNASVVIATVAGTQTMTATFNQGADSYTITANIVSTDINDVPAASAKKAVSKYVKNGKVVVEKNGKKYGVNAVEVK